MNELKQMALYIRDLLNLPESDITFGRYNEYDEQGGDNLIVIDSLAPSNVINTSQDFDGEAEEMSFHTTYSGAIIIDFFGVDSRDNAQTFVALNLSEQARQLQQAYNIGVYNVSSIIDLRRLAGARYDARYQLTLNLRYNVTKVIDTLRIDTPEIDIIVNK